MKNDKWQIVVQTSDFYLSFFIGHLSFFHLRSFGIGIPDEVPVCEWEVGQQYHADQGKPGRPLSQEQKWRERPELVKDQQGGEKLAELEPGFRIIKSDGSYQVQSHRNATATRHKEGSRPECADSLKEISAAEEGQSLHDRGKYSAMVVERETIDRQIHDLKKNQREPRHGPRYEGFLERGRSVPFLTGAG